MNKYNSKTVISREGKVLFFGLQDFLDRIAKGDCCFICGTDQSSKEFNNEHVIPNWILKKFNLYDATITLPNGTKLNYGQYKIPCCKDCNSELGKVYENPISELLSHPYDKVSNTIMKDHDIAHLLFKWMSLIFLKVHLKDKNLLIERDMRKNAGYIADRYYWEDIHHIHCVARSHYTGAVIDTNVYGSVFILPALVVEGWGGYDYVDSVHGKAVMLRLGELCIIVVLNDSCAGLSIVKDQIQKITGPLSPFQIREIVAHLNFINLSLKERPIYSSSFSCDGKYKIIAEIPDTLFLLDEEERVVTYGEFLRSYVQEMISDEIKDKEKYLIEIEEGRRSYLFNEKGEFINHSEVE